MRTLLLDIDALFDTRLGTVAVHRPEAASALATNPAYFEREYTDWADLTQGVVDNDTFNAWYASRDETVLRRSMVSGIITFLARLFAEHHRNIIDGLHQDTLDIVINTYPYRVSDNEKTELIAILQDRIFFPDLGVDFCHLSLDELTPDHLDSHYSSAILYDFPTWMKKQCWALAKHPCYGLDMVVPKLFERDPRDLSVEERKKDILGCRISLVEYLSLNFIDAQHFSMLRPDTQWHDDDTSSSRNA